jgi:hypothetical protein
MTYYPLDTKADDNASDGNVTTEDLVVNGSATGDFGAFIEVSTFDKKHNMNYTTMNTQTHTERRYR